MGRRSQPRSYAGARDQGRWRRGRRMVFGDELNPPIYGRLCPDCGHAEFSLDPALYRGWRECPSCG